VARADRSALTRDLTRVMGCAARVTVVGGSESLLDLAESELRALEALWSRFLPDSEITLLNMSAGRPVPVSARTRLLVRQLVQAHEATDGAFDPTQVLELVALGYGSSRHDARLTTALPPTVHSRGDLTLVEIDDANAWVRLPRGTALDPGGLGKGLAADLAAEALMNHGARGALVVVGGDIRVVGAAPESWAWTINIEDPQRPDRALRRVALGDGGVATSSTRSRRWTTDDGHDVHHVIDPTTGAPSDRGITAATVVAGTGAWAEALSTACLVLDADDATTLLTEQGVAGMLVVDDGHVIETAAWQEFAA
jgi:thiamine biosynthesis lipoprotein